VRPRARSRRARPRGRCSDSGDREVTCSSPDEQKTIIVATGPGNDHRAARTTRVVRKLVGGAGDDTLSGSAGVDTLEGGDGADTPRRRPAADSLNGGADPGGPAQGDTAVFAQGREAEDGVTVTVPPSTATQSVFNTTSTGETDQLLGLENVTGGPGADLLVGNGATNVLRGEAGDDQLRGLGGDDVVFGGLGDDVVMAGSSPDGRDTIDGGDDSATGRGDYVYYGHRTAPVRVVLADADAGETEGNGAEGEDDAIHGIESAYGGQGGDVLIGSAGANQLYGGPGDDTMSGSGGADTLEGDAGADDLDAGEGDDVVEARDGAADAPIACGEGADRLRADNLLEASERPAGCDTIAPQFGDGARLPLTPRVGDTVKIQALVVTGDATAVQTAWTSCASAEGDDCRPLAEGATYDP
jgi:Ca2+-binding RTX toxin-like protein